MPIFDKDLSEAMVRHLLDGLRRKLVKIHQRSSTCIATPADFVIAPGGPAEKRLVGRV
jgi:hypothetical protein